MIKLKGFCAVILSCLMIITAGMLTVNAQNTDEADTKAGNTALTIHYKGDGNKVPYIYYWNSLPNNIQTKYPGVAMTKDNSLKGENWYTYTFDNITKINMIFTDKDGNQLSKELTRTTDEQNEWWYKGRWYKSNPDEADTVDSIDMREETIYFVITTRFYDGDTGNNVHCWDDKNANNPDSDPAWRGDFKGLADKLDYIKALGFSAIWITPVVTNGSGYDYHGYHAFDFSTVDVRYESSDFTFDDLIDAVHEKDMKIIQDVVWQHTGNFGEATFEPLFDKVYNTVQDLADIEKSMIPNERLLSEYGLKSAAEYYAQPAGTQHDQRLRIMKDMDITANNYSASDYNGFVKGIAYDKQQPDRISHSDKYNRNNYYHNNYWRSYNWDDYATQYSQIAGDCVDLNTENPEVGEKLVEIYSSYIERGVDAFRVDTLRHMSRLSLNTMFNDQLNEVGGPGFYMFGEACTRANETWYRGMASESACFYTWDEPDNSYINKWNWTNTPEAVGENMNLTLDHWIDNYNPSEQPTSDNALLSGINYHQPDYSQNSGMNVIDFPMHWNFASASGAFNAAKSGDKYYNDSTWNVVYVDSHDYGPGTENRYEGGTQAWAENLDLMFTFRGIPCLYYGSEIEFQKGVKIDKGTNGPLSTTGRAYFGDNLEGTVTATNFSEYTNTSGQIEKTLNSTLSQHLMKLNAIRRAIPALQKGQYSVSSSNVSGNMAYIRRYTNADEGVDSLALVTISNGATFKGIPNGKYIDAVTGDVKTVTNGTLTVPSIGKSNMRVYVCCASGFTGINGAIGKTNLTYLK